MENYHFETPIMSSSLYGIVDCFAKIVVGIIFAIICFWFFRCLKCLWRMHNEKMRELDEINRLYFEHLRFEHLRTMAGGDDAIENSPPGDDDDDTPRQIEGPSGDAPIMEEPAVEPPHPQHSHQD